jgi:DNA-binding response OmpR family regulator
MDKLEFLKTLNLLYVEDDRVSASVFTEIFEEFFQKVYHASDGIEALEIFKKDQVHIIITDIKMPKMDGLELVSIIREVNENIPIFVISSHSQKEQLFKAITLKLSDYIIKPLSYEKIKESLLSCVDKLQKNANDFILVTSKDRYIPFSRILVSEEKEERLQNKEALLLELLIKHRNKIVTKEMIAYEIYGDGTYSEGSIKNLILKLRKKIGSDYIKTIKHSGYSLL